MIPWESPGGLSCKVNLFNSTKRHRPQFPIGLKAAGAVLGDESLFGEDKWDYVGKYNQEQRSCHRNSTRNGTYSVFFLLLGRHEGYYISKVNQTVSFPSGEQVDFLPEELINVEYSHKVLVSLRVAPPSVN
jgi:hypothetical protein